MNFLQWPPMTAASFQGENHPQQASEMNTDDTVFLSLFWQDGGIFLAEGSQHQISECRLRPTNLCLTLRRLNVENRRIEERKGEGRGGRRALAAQD